MTDPKWSLAAGLLLLLTVSTGLASGQGFGKTIKDCADCPELVMIPAGTFSMGSAKAEAGRFDDEGPQHQVNIPAPLAVGRFKVTFDDWDACVAAGGCSGYRPADYGWGRGRRPVINVGWDDAKTYVLWLSRKTGNRYRLLSEAEWEYAARAGTVTAWSCGRTARCLESAAWHQGNAGGRTQPVGKKAANAFGLHDIHGDAAEWVEDCWHDSYAGAPADGSAWVTDGDCSFRVLRGGAFFDKPGVMRSATRGAELPDHRGYGNGLRIARASRDQ